MTFQHSAAIAAELEASLARFQSHAMGLEAVLDASANTQVSNTEAPKARRGRPHKLPQPGCSCRTCDGTYVTPPPPPTGPLPLVTRRRRGRSHRTRKAGCSCQTCAILAHDLAAADAMEARIRRVGLPRLGFP